jgi:hypothetical protein
MLNARVPHAEGSGADHAIAKCRINIIITLTSWASVPA